MTPSIALVFGILVIALALLVSGYVRMDVVALLVLGALALTGGWSLPSRRWQASAVRRS
jgi:hypothetical protein